MLKQRAHRPSQRRAQKGISLVESLAAILVLALGVGGLAWTQARQLADGRDSAARAAAVLAIHDLTNRMLFNHHAVARGDYRLGWDEQPAAPGCEERRCSGTELARADLASWRAALARSVRGGNATVFPAAEGSHRIGIAVAWPSRNAAQQPRVLTREQHGLECPQDHLCHVVYASL
ncbi:type IV pilus modification PilV family protein [Pseudorhodoferax sp.]|uniref:type IV pilus modification PilV family protein n=1 Tax=Pseudorhodoferax sp. TaxID=1993553 RepID=UPI0039E45234